MEIYKLTDNISERPSVRTKAEVAENIQGKFLITGLKQGVRNENRVNIYVNGKYSFSLDIAQVVDLKVKIGRELTEAEFGELKRASEYGKLYQRALEWVLTRPRSEKETREYLRRKIRTWSSEDISEFSARIIQQLRGKGYIDDRKFAEYYVKNRFVKKGVSEKRLKMELVKKGVAKEIIEEVLSGSERSDAEEIKKIIAKKRAKYDDDKLVAYLCQQGFSYDLVREMMEGEEG
ncbi:RecX family transcriptional regulator [Candidatus Saccharibacteria bacterium]|nr:RecX family transcriptional regulator [Candidatus Saccharibacteria bacterium]